jgi:hypothetical protein
MDAALPMLVFPPKISDERYKRCHRGLSYWRSWLKCHKQYVLDKQNQESTNSAAGVGVYFHKILEYYYQGKLENVALDADPSNYTWNEALRLFSSYRLLFPPNEFTRVVACEHIINAGVTEKHSLPSSWDTEQVTKSRRCKEKFGVPELGGIVDMVVDIEEPHLSVLKRTRVFSESMEPGRYLLDTKTKTKRHSDMELRFFRDIQFATYMMLAEDDPEIGPVKGMIASAIIRHVKLEDKKSFVSTVVPPPTDDMRDFVKSTLTRCFEMREDSFRRGREVPANSEFCEMYDGCPHLANGTCDRR